MAKNVITIPATRNVYTAAPLAIKKKRKVAGYARVSTDKDDQENSYEAQLDYYTKYIQSNPDWEFVSVYADEGITGTSTVHRNSFNTMVQDALDGKIDLILTKSVSRFARNTVDALTTVRQLKERGIEVYFDKEHISSLDSKGEVMLTVMSSLAQEESRSISENCTWGQRKRMADGKVSVPFGRFLGYDRGPNGELIVNEEQAQIVRRIYGLFLQGLSYYNIAKQLTAEGVPTPGGKEQWRTATIRSILSNEKYKGDALLQKSFCTDFLTKKFKVNEGEVPQYYVENDHIAIIEPQIFDIVQREILKRKAAGKNYSSAHPFSCKIRCVKCGSWYGSKVWHSNSKYRTVIWQCNHKYDKQNKDNKAALNCTTPHLTDDQIKQAFLEAINRLLSCKDEVLANVKEMTAQLFDTTALEKEQAGLMAETQLVSEMVKQCIRENASIALDQNDYQKRYDTLVQRFDTAKAKLDDVENRIQQLKLKRAETENFVKAFEHQPDTVTEFSNECWLALVDHATAYADGTLGFTLKNGTEIK